MIALLRSILDAKHAICIFIIPIVISPSALHVARIHCYWRGKCCSNLFVVVCKLLSFVVCCFVIWPKLLAFLCVCYSVDHLKDLPEKNLFYWVFRTPKFSFRPFKLSLSVHLMFCIEELILVRSLFNTRIYVFNKCKQN